MDVTASSVLMAACMCLRLMTFGFVSFGLSMITPYWDILGRIALSNSFPMNIHGQGSKPL